MKHITVNLLDYFWETGIKPIIERIDNLHQVASTGKYTDLIEKPTALKNPHTLNFTGGVTENYDGSVDKSVRIPSITNNLLANVPGTALDAVQGKVLADELSQLNINIEKIAAHGFLQNLDNPEAMFGLVNGWGDDEYLKDFPPDIKYTMGILITVWNWRSDIGGGNPNASRMQVLIYRSKVKTRFGTTGDWNTVSGGWG